MLPLLSHDSVLYILLRISREKKVMEKSHIAMWCLHVALGTELSITTDTLFRIHCVEGILECVYQITIL